MTAGPQRKTGCWLAVAAAFGLVLMLACTEIGYVRQIDVYPRGPIVVENTRFLSCIQMQRVTGLFESLDSPSMVEVFWGRNFRPAYDAAEYQVTEHRTLLKRSLPSFSIEDLKAISDDYLSVQDRELQAKTHLFLMQEPFDRWPEMAEELRDALEAERAQSP